MARLAALAAVLLGVTAGPAAADPINPLDLVRGLRENGMTDLALKYLDEEVAKSPSTDVKAVLPLERAQVRLAAAEDETDEGQRAALLDKAKTDLDAFLKANAKHPRVPEASVALARVGAVQAKGMLARAAKLEDDAAYKAGAAAARTPFLKAAEEFGRAAKALDEQIKGGDLTPLQKQQATRELVQALLDQAVTNYQVSRTYVQATAGEVVQRGDYIKKAKQQFLDLAKAHPDSPAAWVAKAWAGECEIAMDTRPAADKLFDEVRRSGLAASVAGKRMVQFFDARVKYGDALTKPSPQTQQAARTATADWLKMYGFGRPTPEFYAVLYYDADLKRRDAIQFDEKTKTVKPKPNGMGLLREAEREFRKITATENEYTDRAASKRTEVIRVLVGDGEKDPAKITQFDEAVMAALVQFDTAMRSQEKDEAKKKAQLANVVALLERATTLPAPRDAAQELLDTQIRLSFAYRIAGDPYRAAALGEGIARSTKSPSSGAKAGMYAIQAYQMAAAKLPAEDATSRAADLDRAANLARYLDKTFPADPNTDLARITLGQMLRQDKKEREAFDVLSRVNPSSDRVTGARLLQATVAFDLLRPATEGNPGLPQKDRDAVYKQIVADIRKVPVPSPDATDEAAEQYGLLSVLLAQAHLTAGPAGYAAAEKDAVRAATVIAGFKNLAPPEKEALGMQAEETRLRAVYAQTAPLARDGKYEDVLKRIDPEVETIDKAGAAVKEGQDPGVAAAAKRLDDFRREYLLVMALQTQIRQKNVDKASALFDLLKKLGGSLDASVQALNQLLSVVKPQIDALEKEGKADDAKALIDGVANLLDKVSAEPNLTPKVQMFLGRGLKDIKAYDKAVEVLEKIPAPDVPADVLASPAKAADDATRIGVLMYRGSRLDLARTYRAKKDFAKADEVLKAAMGTDEKPGFAKTAPDFKKEALYLIEARAAEAADPKEATKLWAEAKGGWDKIANEYRGMMRVKLPAVPPEPPAPPENASAVARKKYEEDLANRQKIEQSNAERRRQMESVVKPLYYDAFYESVRCLAAANAQILKADPAKLAALMNKLAATIKDVEDNNPGLSDETKDKFASLRAEYPAIQSEYDRLVKAEPPKPAPKEPGADAEPGTDPAAKPAASADPAAQAATDDAMRPVAPPQPEDSGSGLLIAGAAAVLLSLGIVGFLMTGKKKGPAPKKYGVKKADGAAPSAKAAPTAANGPPKPAVKPTGKDPA